MSFDLGLAFLSLAGGMALLIGASLSRSYEKTLVAPATTMLLTWGVALVVLSFLPLIGFYQLSAEAVILYVIGAGWFAVVGTLTAWLLNQYSRPANQFSRGIADPLNYSRLLLFWAVIAAFAYPLAVINVLSFGSDIVEISYKIRMASVAGESILHPVVSNLFVLLGVLANFVLFGVVQKKVKLVSFLILVAPLVVISLIVAGRSGLVSLILGWLVIYSMFANSLKIHHFAVPVLLLLFVVYFGGVWVKKFEVEGQAASSAVLVLAEHIFGYLYQGPILFSRYYTGEIDITSTWDFLNSSCHILSKISLCDPLPQHQDFASYGENRLGNVYSIYFSIIPKYGILALPLVFGFYSSALTVLFWYMKRRNVFSIAVYPLMFSALVLSVFSDHIGYSAYWAVKVLIICFFISALFSGNPLKKIGNQ